MTSTKTLVGEDSPEVGTSAILPMDLVRRLGVRGAVGCFSDLSKTLFVPLWVATIMIEFVFDRTLGAQWRQNCDIY